jgi:hypothetical protein
MDEPLTFGVELEQVEGYEFRVRFDWPDVPELTLDEPEPLGRKQGPNAARRLKSKFRQNPGPVRAMASGRMERSERGRYRIAGIDVVLSLSEKFGDLPHQERCLEQFEDFCIVTQSIRAGIPVSVNVVDATGKVADAVA